MKRSGLVAALALVVGCGGSPGPSACGTLPCLPERSVVGLLQTSLDSRLDLLFIVDDTAAVADRAAALADGYAAMARLLEQFPLGMPSLHVGFASASPCALAPTTRAAGCGVAPPAAFLTAENCGRVTNTTGSFEATFSCLADLGAASCGPAAPLDAVRAVLGAASPPGWEPFLRREAYLQIVVVAGADDASTTPVDQAISFVHGLKDDPSRVSVSVIGPGDCTDAGPSAPAARLGQFFEGFGSNGLYLPLCSGRLEAALAPLTSSVEPGLPGACIAGIRDVDPATPGVQAQCAVDDHVTPLTGSPTEGALPSCDVGPPPCWRLSPAPDWPACAGSLVFSIDRGSDWCPGGSTQTRFDCLGCFDPADPACAVPPASGP